MAVRRLPRWRCAWRLRPLLLRLRAPCTPDPWLDDSCTHALPPHPIPSDVSPAELSQSLQTAAEQGPASGPLPSIAEGPIALGAPVPQPPAPLASWDEAEAWLWDARTWSALGCVAGWLRCRLAARSAWLLRAAAGSRAAKGKCMAEALFGPLDLLPRFVTTPLSLCLLLLPPLAGLPCCNTTRWPTAPCCCASARAAPLCCPWARCACWPPTLGALHALQSWLCRVPSPPAPAAGGLAVCSLCLQLWRHEPLPAPAWQLTPLHPHPSYPPCLQPVPG